MTFDAEGAQWDLPHPGPGLAKKAMGGKITVPPVLSHELMGCPAAIQSRPGFGCEPYEKPNNRAKSTNPTSAPAAGVS